MDTTIVGNVEFEPQAQDGTLYSEEIEISYRCKRCGNLQAVKKTIGCRISHGVLLGTKSIESFVNSTIYGNLIDGAPLAIPHHCGPNEIGISEFIGAVGLGPTVDKRK